MTPTYNLNSSPSPFPNLQASSSSSFSCHIFFDSTQDQSAYYHRELQQQQEANNNHGSHEESYDIQNESRDNCLKLSLWKKDYSNENQISENNISVKWMSSKMRLMQKMKKSDGTGVKIATQNFQDQKQPSSPIDQSTENSSSNTSSNNSNNIPVRVCADCNTTKTPLWRGGPRGPKSLCNACGIRQRKARRAAAAAAAAANGTIVVSTETPSMKTKVHQKDKRSNKGHVGQYKKRSKLAIPSDHARKKLCFEDFLISLRKNLAFHSVFPQDEKEAAILLMALSCGLVHD